MSLARWLGGAALVAALGFGAWQGADWLGIGRAAAPPIASNAAADTAVDTGANAPVAEGAPVVTDVADVAALTKGETPMAERVAVIGFLNKRNGNSRDLTLKPGQAVRVGDAIIRLRACEKTAPWEQDQLTGAFLQLDVAGTDKTWRRVFSGWIYKERPSLNVVQNAVYDVWPKSCTMSFPAAGPDTVTLSASPPANAQRRESSADQSPTTEGAPVANPAVEAPSAAPSNTL
jgi:hypothetical protein